MKALVKSQAGEGLWLQDVPEPEYGINDVLIRVLKTGICGTDVHIFNWDDWSQKNVRIGTVLGHEFVGRIAAVGSNVSGHAVGDLVTGEGHIVCGHCRNCLAGRRHLCAHTQGIGIHRHGAFAEYVAVPAGNVWACAPGIATDIFAIFDPLGNAMHVAGSFPLLGEDVLITGAGPIGIMALAMARHAGARHVVVTDVNPHRLELAARLHPSALVDVRTQSVAEVMQRLGMTEGFDVGFEMSGHPAGLRTMLESMAHGGSIAMLGIQPPDTGIDWDAVVFKGLHIKGIYGREMFETWYKLTAMLQSGLDITPIITHRFPYTEFAQGFAAMRSGQSGKVILEWAAS